jgi:hypothetical protein
MNNKRQRTDKEDVSPAPDSSTTFRVPKLRLSDVLAIKFGTRYCTDNELVTLMLSQKMYSCVSTFEVKATLMPARLSDLGSETRRFKAANQLVAARAPWTCS